MANIFTNQKNVTTSGTPVQLPAQSVDDDQKVLVKAKLTNTGTITVGYSSSTALNTNSTHFKLTADQGIELGASDASQIWIDSTVSGEGVEILIAK